MRYAPAELCLGAVDVRAVAVRVNEHIDGFVR